MVTLNPENHIYTDGGQEYASVTKVISSFSNFFDAEKVSYFVAQNRSISQDEVLEEWDNKRQEASDYGHYIHENVSLFLKTGERESALEPLWDNLVEIFQKYSSIDSEQILINNKYYVAGTADVLAKTTRHPRCIVDFFDIKTNLQKGIQFSSPFKKYMHFPLKHLSDCNYNTYSLQLSLYAWLLQKQEEANTGNERKIGELAILFINPDMTITRLPVSYLKLEVEAMLEQYQKIKGINLTW